MRAHTLILTALTLLAGVALSSPAAAAVPDQFQASHVAEAKGDYAGALAQVQAIPARGGDAYLVHLRTGWLQYNLGQHTQAVQAYQQALAAEPNSVEAQLGLTLPLMALRRWADAERTLHQALKAAPGHYTAQSRLAYVRYQAGRFKAAEQAYAAVLKLHPGDTEMRAGLGWSQLKQGRTTEARRAFDFVLRILPKHQSALAGMQALTGA